MAITPDTTAPAKGHGELCGTARRSSVKASGAKLTAPVNAYDDGDMISARGAEGGLHGFSPSMGDVLHHHHASSITRLISCRTMASSATGD